MDPKQNGSQPLDPKLQEVYDRVMGTSLSGDSSTSPATAPSPIPQVKSVTDPMQSTPQSSVPAPSMPSEPAQPPMPPAPIEPAEPSLPQMPPVPVDTPVPNPVPPVMPVDMPATPPTTPSEPPVAPAQQPTPDTMSATMSMPQVIPHATETVTIGAGGSPVNTEEKHRGKGISPLILIFGAFAFLAVYAVFWVKFLGYSLPFLPK